MTEIFKFFNSAPNDPRTYQAADFADYFGSVLSTGLLHTDEVPGLSASVESGTLNTIVSTGKAIMKGHLYENTSPLTLTHSIPEATLDRIDRLVLRYDSRNSVRDVRLHVVEGAASATPVAPTLQRDNFIYEISIAQIRVRANTVQLLQSDLVDERLDEDLAGLVYSLISIPTSQFQAQWDAFMEGIQESGFTSKDEFEEHLGDFDNPHQVTKAQVGLPNVENKTVNEIRTDPTSSFRVEVVNSLPAVGNKGRIVFDDTDDMFKGDTGGEWL